MIASKASGEGSHLPKLGFYVLHQVMCSLILCVLVHTLPWADGSDITGPVVAKSGFDAASLAQHNALPRSPEHRRILVSVLILADSGASSSTDSGMPIEV